MYTPDDTSATYVRRLHDDTARARATLETLTDITLGHIRGLPRLDEVAPARRQLYMTGGAFVAQLLPESPEVPYSKTAEDAARHTLTIGTRVIHVTTHYFVRSQIEGEYSGRVHECMYEYVLPTDEFTIQGLAQLASGLHHLHGSLVTRLQSQSV